jgi:sulfite exporter TauE/SafE
MNEATVLLWAAVSIAFLHTLVGIDHYLPFVLIGKARGWNLRKTLSLTALCGVGHVLGSVLLGAVGIGIGVALNKLTWIEGIRGSVAAWSLITFGLVYAAWSMVRTARGQHHSHVHVHEDGVVHTHGHDHHGDHMHVHSEPNKKPTLTGWTLFIIFVFGPCEALIPLLMAPAYKHNWGVVWAVTLLFSAVTVVTMLGAVAVGYFGLSFAPIEKLEKHANTIAGLTIAFSGLAIQVLGI